MLERGVHPVIPEKGFCWSKRRSGALAHLALTAIGEGEAVFQGRLMSGAEALKQAGIEPLLLEAKERTRLVKWHAGHGSGGGLALNRADKLARAADIAGAMTLEALRGTPTAFDDRIHAARRIRDRGRCRQASRTSGR